MSFIDDVNGLLVKTPSSGTEWADLTRDLRPEYFDFVLTLLDRQQPQTANALQLAFQNFATWDAGFCTFLALAVTRREDPRFRAGFSTFANRIALRALIDAAAARTEADPDLLQAFAFHRGYQETIPGPSTIGSDVRLRLRNVFEQILQPTAAFPEPAFRIVPAFRYVLRDTDKLTTISPPDWDDRAFVLEVLQHLTHPDTRKALHWGTVTTFEREPLYLLADALAFVLNDTYPYGDGTRAAVDTALLQVVECAVQLWSVTYDGWDLLVSNSVNAQDCLRAEAYLHEVVECLELHNGQGYFGPQAVTQYHDWIELCGGFDHTECVRFVQEPSALLAAAPVPLAQRDWLRAESQGRKNGLLFSVAPYQFVRHFDLLHKPDSSDREEISRLTDTEFLRTVSQELWSVAIAQNLVANFDLVTAEHPAAGSPVVGTGAYLPHSTVARDRPDSRLHSDHLRALRIMTAATLQWRADIAYRTAGPRIIVSGFTSDQQREIDCARSLYALALDLVGGENDQADDRFTAGLGILGIGLEQRRRELRDECFLRLLQIGQGYDWSAAAIEWPVTYMDDIQLQLTELLRVFDVTDSLDAITIRHTDLTTAIEERTLAIQQAEQEAGAADKIVEGESFTLEALTAEETTATVRKQIAEFRKGEAQYQAAARRFAVAAAGQKAEAKNELEQIEKEIEHQLEGQLQILQQQIQKLVGSEGKEGTLPALRRQIGEARTNLDRFNKDAVDRHQEKQSHNALISIVKKIGSLVSIYFTGVDLVTIAESAVQAVKSAQSGDWAGAIIHAKEAGDLATGGKFTEALNRSVADAERYIGNVMADSLGDAANVLKEQMGIEPNKATEAAIAAVSRQAFRLGVSYLAKETGTKAIFAALGVPDPEPGLVENLRMTAEQQLVDAAWQTFHNRGDEALKGLASVLNTDLGQVEAKLKEEVRTVEESGKSVELRLVQILADVESRNPQAKGILAELKNEFLAERDRLTDHISKVVGKEKTEVEHALDQIAGQALAATEPGSLPIPPVALPVEVLKALNDFRRKTESARSKLGFLTAPGKANELANQLSDAQDDAQFNENLSRVVGDLTKNIDDADQAMHDAEDDLAALMNQLTQTQVEVYKQHFREQAAGFETQAATSDAQAAAQMGNAAAEEVLASEQQVRIEEFGIDIAQKRRAAQQSLVEAKRSLADATKTEIEIRKLALKRAQSALDEWTRKGQLNPDQKRTTQAVQLWCLSKANTLLAQWWQLLNLYEVSERLQRLADDPTQTFAPTFLLPDKPKIVLGQNLLRLAQSQWNIDLLESPRLMTTIDFGRIRTGLSDDEQRKLRGFFTQVENQLYPCLKLHGRGDLQRLLGGITFQIRRYQSENPDAPFDYVKNLPLSAFTDTVATKDRIHQQTGTTFLESETFPAWDDAGSTRIRLLGVLLNVDHYGTLRSGVQLKLLLRQEGDPDIYVRDPQAPANRLRTRVPLQAMKSEDDYDRGVLLAPGAFTPAQWQTRPLFGTYTVRMANTLRDFLGADDFSAEIHFVALGRP